MSRNFGIIRQATNNRQKRTFGREMPPQEAWGDIGCSPARPLPDHVRDREKSAARRFGAIKTVLGALAIAAFFAALTVWLWAELNSPAHAHDDGRYASSALKSWFDSLASGKGLCCSVADGRSITDVDWDTHDGRYRVRLDGAWIDVPDDAVVSVPNRYGPAVVWPYQDETGATKIRCFMPGAGT